MQLVTFSERSRCIVGDESMAAAAGRTMRTLGDGAEGTHVATDTGRSGTWAASRQDRSARGRVAAWVAWGTCGFYWVAISVGYVLQLSHGTAAEIVREAGWRLGYGSFATVGAVIVSRRPRHVVGWILCVVGITAAVAGFAQDYAAYALLRRQEWLPGGLVMGWLGSWPWYIAFGLITTFLLLLFPDGRLPSHRWRPVAWAAGVDIVLFTVWAAFAPRPLEGPPGMSMPQNPWGIERAAGLFELLLAIAGWALLGLVVLSLASLVLRFRRSRGEQRQQLKWFTYAALLTVGAWLIFTPLAWKGRSAARCCCSPRSSASGWSRRRSGSRSCATTCTTLTD
jgi:hypothetical protein